MQFRSDRKRLPTAGQSLAFGDVVFALAFMCFCAIVIWACVKPVHAREQEFEPKPVSEPQASSAEGALEPRLVRIYFDDVDILVFVRFISEVTGKNFLIDPKVKGRVTVLCPTKVTVVEAYKIFESVLEVHGFTTVPAGNIIKIVPSAEARGKGVETKHLP